MTRFSWDDLRLFLAVEREGGVLQAAEALGVNHTTLYRRLATLEERLGARLIERGGRGVTLTAAGEELLAAAERMNAAADNALLKLTGRDLAPAGTVRVTAPDDLMHYVLIPALPSFNALYPKIQVELVVDNRHLNLTRREADIAVRATAAPQETLVGRRALPVETALFYPAAFAERPRAEWTWAAWEAGAGPAVAAAWMAREAAAEQVILRANSMLNLARAVESGAAAALLPGFLGARLSGVERERLGHPLEEQVAVWVLTHPDLRNAARIRLTTEFIYQQLTSLAAQESREA
jgi:molybdate transport repressor ModE-like protein